MPKHHSEFFCEGAPMPFPNSISTEKLVRLIGTANTPALIDVRPEHEFESDARLIPAAVRRNHEQLAEWGSEFAGRSAIVISRRGQQIAQGVAGWLRHI